MTTLAVQGARAGSGGRAILLALGVSLIVHLAVYRSMARRPAQPRVEETPVQVQWIEETAYAPAKVLEAPPAKPSPRLRPPAVVKAVHKGPAQVKSAPSPVQVALPQPPAAEPPRPPPPVLVGLNFASTVAKSGFVVPVGTTLSGAPPRVAPAAPASAVPARSGRTGRYVAFDQVSEPPVLLAEIRASYPEAARTAGITGEVVLLITIDAQGSVTEARRISGPGHGLDDAALAAIWRFRFRPAQQDGEPVTTVIRYIYSFDIN